MKKFVSAVLFVFLTVPGFVQEDHFSWQMGLYREGAGEITAYLPRVELRSGDLVNLKILSKARCYLYAFVYQADRRIKVLFNGELPPELSRNLSLGFLPPGDNQLFVFVTREKEEPLGKLLGDYQKNPGPADKLYAEAKDLRARLDALPAAAKPKDTIGQGGASRGPERGYSGKSGYARTIILYCQ
ncbi:MAG: hypothetical protein LBC31_03725 [Treponema sp.]|jgi:hypothetical protein|nr:hypothetical protein [Treponema sp.]